MKPGDQGSGNGGAGIGAIGYWLAFIFVFVGLLNVTPAIPGWDQLFKVISGNDEFKIRRFPTEWLYPLLFFVMMVVVTLKHSIWRSWRDRPPALRRFGLLLDVALIVASAAISLTYLVELEAVCLLDIFTGDRARLVAEALRSEVEYSEMMGLPIPVTADDPACLNTTHNLLPLILFGSVVVFLPIM